MNHKFNLFIFSAILFGAITSSVFAGNSQVYFSAPTSVAPGSVINVTVYADAADPINTLEAEISYSKELLELTGFDNSGSIINLWQHKPAVTATGSIEFLGGMLEDFSGSRGKLVVLQFKALTVGVAKIKFSTSRFIKADGQGTIIKPAEQDIGINIASSAQSITEPQASFTDTAADVEVKQGIESIKHQIWWRRSYTVGIIGVVLVFFAILLYNKRKRKI